MKTGTATRIVLMGNPNIGKSAVFSRLTGARVIVSNYPGSTVDFAEGRLVVGDTAAKLIDPPGTYNLHAANKAEEVAALMLESADLIINVLDATNLERNLFLTLELLELGKPLIVALNMWDEAKHLGITINVDMLQDLLGVPVVPTVALTGEGIKELAARLPTPGTPKPCEHVGDEDKWKEIGRIVGSVQTMRHRHHSIRDRLADATITPITGLPVAALILASSFWIVRNIGEGLINYVLDPLFNLYLPLATRISKALGEGFVHDVLIGQLVNDKIDPVQSLGLLTTAFYVPFVMVLPYIMAFYLILCLLEDTGYLPRLATLMDNLFHKLGMHGHGIVPLCLALGCNVAGVLAARTLETRKQRFICTTLISISVPCAAQSAMILRLLGDHDIAYTLVVFSSLFMLYIAAGLILSRVVKGSSPEIFLEIPPYRLPSAKVVLKKTSMRVRWFLLDAIPWLFAGVLAINILFVTGILEWLGEISSPLVVGWLGLPKEASTALLAGFLRKDLAVGMLLPLEAKVGMTAAQLTVAATVLTVYFPCAATFAVLLKELRPKDMLKATGIMVIASLAVGGLLRLALM